MTGVEGDSLRVVGSGQTRTGGFAKKLFTMFDLSPLAKTEVIKRDRVPDRLHCPDLNSDAVVALFLGPLGYTETI
jgi:hypothetical protein